MVDIEYYFVAAMLAYVGMNPRKDIEWVDTEGYENFKRSFIDRRVQCEQPSNLALNRRPNSGTALAVWAPASAIVGRH